MATKKPAAKPAIKSPEKAAPAVVHRSGNVERTTPTEIVFTLEEDRQKLSETIRSEHVMPMDCGFQAASILLELFVDKGPGEHSLPRYMKLARKDIEAQIAHLEDDVRHEQEMAEAVLKVSVSEKAIQAYGRK